MALMNAAVVGGGITASLIGFLSKNSAVNFDLWESDQELGGRMKTFKCQHLRRKVDIGAQYITTNVETSKNSEIYVSLLKFNKIKPFTGEIINQKQLPVTAINYVAPQGMDSLVYHFVNCSNFRNIHLNKPIIGFNIDQSGIELIGYNGQTRVYHSVILTMPVPIILNLEGNFKEMIPDETFNKLLQIKYSSRDCLVLFFNKALPTSWAAKYLTDDDIFKYVSIQENKVGITDSYSSVVFHTSIQFSEKYNSISDEVVKLKLFEHAKQLFPEWTDPTEIRHYKWNYSQVLESYENTPKCLVVSEKPLVIIAGDAFTTSNFDGCVTSAQSVVDIIRSSLTN